MKVLPGTIGYVATQVSSRDKKAIAKLTQANHIYSLTQGYTTPYDKTVVDIWSKTTAGESGGFIEMVNNADVFEVDSDTFHYHLDIEKDPPAILEIPSATASKLTTGAYASDVLDVVYDSDYFTGEDIISSNMMYRDKYQVVSFGGSYGDGWLYRLKLVGETVNDSTPVDVRDFVVGRKFDKVDYSHGEHDQELSGLSYLKEKIRLYNSIPADYGVTHTITTWADRQVLKNANGDPLDLVVYDQYKVDNKGKAIKTGSKWEPVVEQLIREEMMKIRKNRYLYGDGGVVTTGNRGQERKKLVEGVIPQMRRHGNHVSFPKGSFSINLLRESIGSMFRGKVAMKDRKVLMYANEAGIKLFRQSNKDDLTNSGFTIIADNRFIEGSHQDMVVNYGFSEAFTMETGRISVKHLPDLDKESINPEDRDSDRPIFIIFELGTDSDKISNIRQVRWKGETGYTFGYVQGTRSPYGFAASQNMQSANMFNGYQLWQKDHGGLFIEDFSKTMIVEEEPVIA